MAEDAASTIPKDVQIALVDKAHLDVQEMIASAVDAAMQQVNYQLKHGRREVISPGLARLEVNIHDIQIKDGPLYEEIVYALATKRAANLLELEESVNTPGTET